MSLFNVWIYLLVLYLMTGYCIWLAWWTSKKKRNLVIAPIIQVLRSMIHTFGNKNIFLYKLHPVQVLYDIHDPLHVMSTNSWVALSITQHLKWIRRPAFFFFGCVDTWNCFMYTLLVVFHSTNWDITYGSSFFAAVELLPEPEDNEALYIRCGYS